MGVVDNIKGFFGKTLYYPGCTTRFKLPDTEARYKNILTKLGINFVTFDKIICCGLPLLNAGYKKEFEDLMERNKNELKKKGINKIIVNCPECYHTFKNDYGMKVVHVSQLLAKNKSKLLPRTSEEATYHDPCYFARYSKIMEEPRTVLRASGITIKEFDFCRDKTLCCGAGGNMKFNFPDQSNKIAKLRLSKLKTDTLITPCPHCYLQFKENSNKKIVELSEVIEL
jgi:Fe-S oxidoreductase